MSQPDRLDGILERIKREPVAELTPEQRTAREEAERRWAEHDAQEDARARVQWKDETGVPKRYRAARFEGARQTAALRAVRGYLDGEDYKQGRCLVLASNPGSGKTFAACAALDYLASQARRPYGHVSLSLPTACFYHFPGLIAELLDSQRRAAALWSAKSNRVLVLDDFGATYIAAGGLAEALVEEIMVEREAEMLATIVTTNLTADELRQKLSDRLVDRLGGDWGRIVAVTGPSLRRKGQ